MARGVWWYGKTKKKREEYAIGENPLLVRRQVRYKRNVERRITVRQKI